MTKKLDDIDMRMIQLLRQNARTPLVKIAKQVGLSRSATQERLTRLEDHGIIAGYTVRFSPPDETITQSWIFLKLAPGLRCSVVVPALLRHSEVRLCHSIAGEIDVILRVEVDSNTALAALRERLIAEDGVAEVVTAPVLELHT